MIIRTAICPACNTSLFVTSRTFRAAGVRAFFGAVFSGESAYFKSMMLVSMLVL
jgi:hypothetical protein